MFYFVIEVCPLQSVNTKFNSPKQYYIFVHFLKNTNSISTHSSHLLFWVNLTFGRQPPSIIKTYRIFIKSDIPLMHHDASTLKLRGSSRVLFPKKQIHFFRPDQYVELFPAKLAGSIQIVWQESPREL